MHYAFGTSAVGFGYKGLFKQTFGKWDLNLLAGFKGPRYIFNYYELGNNTELIADTKRSFYRARAKDLYFSPGISREWKQTELRAGLQFETVELEHSVGKFVETPFANLDSSVYHTKYFGGANASWRFSSR